MPELRDSQAFLDPDASREYLRSWKENADRTAARAADMAEQMARLRVTATDRNGLAEVVIDSAGVLVDLKLTDRIQRLAPDVVAQGVLDALSRARAEAADRVHAIAVETMGPDSLSARTIADRMRQTLERPAGEDEPDPRTR